MCFVYPLIAFFSPIKVVLIVGLLFYNNMKKDIL